jgi:hypothetical protein
LSINHGIDFDIFFQKIKKQTALVNMHNIDKEATKNCHVLEKVIGYFIVNINNLLTINQTKNLHSYGISKV